jgi:predicted PurR-regulated permease PerM
LINPKTPYTFDRVVRQVITAGVLFGLLWLFSYLSDVLVPFAVAMLLAYLTNPFVDRLQKRISSRAASVIFCLFFIALLGILFLWFLVPLIFSEISNMGRILSQLAGDAEIAKRAGKILPPEIWYVIKDFAANAEIQSFFRDANVFKILQVVTQRVLPGVWGLITGATSFLTGIVGLSVIGLYLVFILIDYQNISRGWSQLIPPAHRDAVVRFLEAFEKIMNQYFRGQAAVAAICGVLFAIGFSIIQLPMGILLGLFIGFLNMVPYMQIIGMIPAFLLAIFMAIEGETGIWMAIGMTAMVFAVVQAIQDLILTPKIMGKVTGLNPAMMILSLSIWGKLLGLLGLIIALPMTYLLLTYYRQMLAAGAELPSETLISDDK